MINYPNSLNTIFSKLNILNIKPIIVGGFIRDSLLGVNSKDIDIELYGVSSLDEIEKNLKNFGDVNSVGKSFGVVKLNFKNLHLDFSLPRVENKNGIGHKGFEVRTFKNIEFKTASRRRDFTINAMGYDVIEKKLLDPYNGVEDLKNRTLEAVNNSTFVEDPLRVLRAIQFSARFNLTLSNNLLLLCKEMIYKDMLSELSSERIFEEIKKLFCKSQKPSIGLKLLKEIGASYYFKEFQLISHNDYSFTLNAIDEMSKLKVEDKKSNLILMLTILVYKLSYSHQQSFLSNLTSDNHIHKTVFKLISHTIDKDMSNYQLFKLAEDVSIKELLTLQKALDSKNIFIYEKLEKRVEKLGVLYKKLPPILQGRDLIKLGLKPSPKFQLYLKQSYEAQMKEKFINYAEALEWLEKELLP